MTASSEPTIQELFNDKNRNQINVAIVGAVSAGKSTLLNTIFANTYSHCKIKRTTMTPQIYYEYSGKSLSKTSKAIKEENKRINETLIKKTEAQETISINDITEAKYIVPRIYNFTKLSQKVFLSVYDIPGLNDARTKDLYFQYLEDNFYKFDIILFVVDINSALNTSDEIEILKKVVTNAKSNNEKFNIHNKLVILANKCDEMSLDEKGELQLEEEHFEMFDQINTQVKQIVSEIFPKLEYDILPLSSEDSYIYRILEQNPDTELDLKYLNKFGYMEFGRTRWNKLSEEKKKAQIKKLMGDWDLDASLEITGFNGFRNTLNDFLSPENQKIFVNNHVIYEIQKITSNEKVDISNELQDFYMFYQKYKELQSRIKVGINVMETFSSYMSKYLDGYKTKVLEGFINSNKNSETSDINYRVKDEKFIPQIESAKEVVDNMVRLFNGDVPMIKALSIMINEALTSFYLEQIDNKRKPISTLFNYISRLLGYKKEVTSENIDNFFENPDILNTSAEKIINYIDDFEKRGLLTTKDKINKILNILIKIYRNINGFATNSEPSNNFIKAEDLPSYVYYTDKFWTKFIMFNNTYDERIEELAFISKANIPQRFYGNSYRIKFNGNKEGLLKLENYFISIYTSSENETFQLERRVKYNLKSKSQSNISDSEDIGSEIDAELGLE